MSAYRLTISPRSSVASGGSASEGSVGRASSSRSRVSAPSGPALVALVGVGSVLSGGAGSRAVPLAWVTMNEARDREENILDDLPLSASPDVASGATA